MEEGLLDCEKYIVKVVATPLTLTLTVTVTLTPTLT